VGPAIAITDILLVMVLAEGERISLSSEFQRAGSPFSYLAIVAVISIFLAGVEEFGWRGYLQLKVSPGRPLIAAIVTGTVWGIWHWPQVWFGDVYFYDVEVGFAHYVVFAIFFSIILGWLRLRTASIWPPTIAHASFNLAIGAYAIRGVLGFEYLVSISCFVWALVILLTGSLGRAAKEQSDR
jgi:membrane protease YdiL (CAAX protease family)